ncbi:hypothetical protein [uncultured Desulfovibrio sp.]|uniref:hypothetical protein n=2 Tax=uncultured Desulfovibrio sp. TaxID=167968 RepID=UPI00261444E1|nr:hypothetical protein [uncultured Desulfovibrio sp.]
MFGKKKQPKSAAPNQSDTPDQKERQAARRPGADRVHAEGLGDAWVAITGRDPAAIMPQVVGTVLHDGGTRPAWQWKRGGREHVLMAWPKDQPVRAAVLMAGEEGGKLAPVTAVPLLEGLPNDLLVESVHPRAEGLGADVAVTMLEGENPLWFFDPLYGRDQDDLTPGITHTFWLAGLALGIRKALLDELAITQGPQFEAHAAAWLEQNPGASRLDVPPLKIPMTGKRCIMPGRRFGEYQIRTVVERVEDCKLENMDVRALYLSFPFEEREPLRLALYASRFVLGDFVPEEGDEVEAYVWLEGRIIDLDGAPAADAGDADAAPGGMAPGTVPHQELPGGTP